MSWDTARKQVRSLETRLDASLNQYSRVAGDITRSGSTSGRPAWPSQRGDEDRKGSNVEDGDSLEREIEQMLTDVSGLPGPRIQHMTDFVLFYSWQTVWTV